MHKLKLLLRSTLIVVGVALSNILQPAYGIEVTLPVIKNTQEAKLPVVKKSVANYRIDNYESSYELNSDYSYAQTIATRTTLLTRRGIDYKQRASFSYYPDSESVSLLEAYVIQPNGEKIPVSNENIFTRPSPDSQNTPGFTNSMTTTVVFPRLMVGSQTFVKWKFTEKKPSVAGFSELYTPVFSEPTTKNTVTISMPAALKLRWKKLGDYIVTDKIQGLRRIITAVIENQLGRKSESGMVSYLDTSPVFLVSNLDSWEEVGAIYWRQSQKKVEVTPEIKELAEKITGKKQGIEAAQAIYKWVTQNIHYVAVYLNEAAGYVPHTTTEVLRNGYGDCKDHVVLMQALLKAKGIDSYPVLVDWGSMSKILPLPAFEFNHAMIYLPAYNIFANPTNQYASFGELDKYLSGKFVVIATEKGATAYTPKAVAAKNNYALTSKVTISADGTVNGESELKFLGNFNSSMRRYFSSNTPEQIANELLSRTPEGGTGTLETSQLDNLDQPMVVNSKWSSPYAIDMGKEIYFTTPVGIDTQTPNSLRQYITSGNRSYPVILGAMSFNWEYKITTPPGYKLNHLPVAINFANATGKYKSSYEVVNEYIHVKRNLVIQNNVYSPEEYPAFKDLIDKCINDARSRMVLEKQ